MIKVLVYACLALLLGWANPAEAKTVALTLCCSADNDLYRVLGDSGYEVARFDLPAEALVQAPANSALLLLADGYPTRQTELPADLFDQAAAKHLKLYIEYPAAVPGLELGEVRHIEWERGVVASDDFGPELPALTIVGIHDCHFLPVEAEHPWLVVARVAGFDTAVFGLPDTASPVLFELPKEQGFVATTKLSQFVTARYSPTAAWTVIWEKLLAALGAPVKLSWQPTVQPAYGPEDQLPPDVEAQAVSAMANWYFDAGMLVPASRRDEVVASLIAAQDSGELPDPIEAGDGSWGILEGLSSPIKCDGRQVERLPYRADCHGEAAFVLALDGLVNGNQRSQQASANLLDYLYFTSEFCKGGRGNPMHPAYGLIAWGELRKELEIANYGDDNARAMLGTLGAAACLGEERWNVPLLRALLANLRTTGPEGFRIDRIDMPELEQYRLEALRRYLAHQLRDPFRVLPLGLLPLGVSAHRLCAFPRQSPQRHPDDDGSRA